MEPFIFGPYPGRVQICRTTLRDFTTRNIGVIMDTHASMEAHVNNVSRTAYYHLYNIGRIRCYLSQPAAEQLVHAFITSKLDYCNALLCGLPSLLTQKPQRIQNAAARIITRTSRSAHITPVLFSLLWLPMCQRIKFKMLVIVFKTKCGTGPAATTSRNSSSRIVKVVNYAQPVTTCSSAGFRTRHTGHLPRGLHKKGPP